MFDKILSESALQSLAGRQSFDRGQKYFKNGKVGKLALGGDSIRAVVTGSERYQVRLGISDGELGFSCNCYYAADDHFCKHCVAVGLAWLAAARQDDAASPSLRAVRAYLEELTPRQVVDLLVDAARCDEKLCRSLLAKAKPGGDSGADAARLRELIEETTEVDGFIPWDEVAEVLSPLHDELDAVEELLAPATAAVWMEVLEYGIGRVEEMLEQLDDSGGDAGDAVTRMGALHLQACALAMLEPAALAERLFALEKNAVEGLWSFDPVRYRDVLGTAGVSRYREIILAESGAAGRERRGWLNRMAESVAEASGDIDELVAAKALDLSAPYRYLQIGEILRGAGRADEAIEWAERGLAAFAGSPAPALHEFLAEAYRTIGKHEKALDMAWKLFVDRPSLAHYDRLARSAAQLGCWPDYRARAVAKVEAGITWERRYAQADLRVEIALLEQDLDAALAFANRGRCDSRLLIRLAAELEASRLDDAGVLYRRLVSETVALTNNQAYESAIALVQRYAAALQAQRRDAELEQYLTWVRAEFKRKRNFIGMLDRCGFAAPKS